MLTQVVLLLALSGLSWSRLPLNMLTQVVLLLALSGLSWSRLPVRRRCDPEERRDTPTLCSNYRNILHLDGIQTELVERQKQLQRRMDAVDTQVHPANISSLQTLVSNLWDNRRSQTEMETQLERHEEDITSLKRLVQHGDRLSETQQRILNLYNATATQLEAAVEARLVAMETRLQARLVAMETRLQAEVQKNNSEGIKHRLKSTEESVAEQSGLGLKAEVDTTVAFSAVIIESGPDRTSNFLIFTNIGNAYSRKTGVFTAPLNGVYHFTFTTSGDNSFTAGGVLVKNGRYRIRTWERPGPDISDTNSNTVILHLNARDTVNVVLWDGGRIRTSVFSGFLVFTTS